MTDSTVELLSAEFPHGGTLMQRFLRSARPRLSTINHNTTNASINTATAAPPTSSGDAGALLLRLRQDDPTLRALRLNVALVDLPDEDAPRAMAGSGEAKAWMLGPPPALQSALMHHHHLLSLEVTPCAFHSLEHPVGSARTRNAGATRRASTQEEATPAAASVEMDRMYQRSFLWSRLLQSIYHLPLRSLQLSGLDMGEAEMDHVLALVAHLAGVRGEAEVVADGPSPQPLGEVEGAAMLPATNATSTAAPAAAVVDDDDDDVPPGSLVFVSLAGSNLTPQQARVLGRIVFHHRSSIRRVDVGECALGDAGVAELLHDYARQLVQPNVSGDDADHFPQPPPQRRGHCGERFISLRWNGMTHASEALLRAVLAQEEEDELDEEDIQSAPLPTTVGGTRRSLRMELEGNYFSASFYQYWCTQCGAAGRDVLESARRSSASSAPMPPQPEATLPEMCNSAHDGEAGGADVAVVEVGAAEDAPAETSMMVAEAELEGAPIHPATATLPPVALTPMRASLMEEDNMMLIQAVPPPTEETEDHRPAEVVGDGLAHSAELHSAPAPVVVVAASTSSHPTMDGATSASIPNASVTAAAAPTVGTHYGRPLRQRLAPASARSATSTADPCSTAELRTTQALDARLHAALQHQPSCQPMLHTLMEQLDEATAAEADALLDDRDRLALRKLAWRRERLAQRARQSGHIPSPHSVHDRLGRLRMVARLEHIAPCPEATLVAVAAPPPSSTPALGVAP